MALGPQYVRQPIQYDETEEDEIFAVRSLIDETPDQAHVPESELAVSERSDSGSSGHPHSSHDQASAQGRGHGHQTPPRHPHADHLSLSQALSKWQASLPVESPGQPVAPEETAAGLRRLAKFLRHEPAKHDQQRLATNDSNQEYMEQREADQAADEVILRLEFLRAELEKRKRRAIENYLKHRAETDLDQLARGFRINCAA